MKTRTLATAALLAVIGAAMAMPVSAQRGPRGRGLQARPGCAESALRLKDGLELTDSQVSQLEALRSSCVERQQTHMAEAAEMRSRLRAGLITPDDFRQAMEARREAAQTARDETRTRLSEILTEEQLNELDRSMVQARRAGRGAWGPRREFRRQYFRGMRGGGRWNWERGRRPGPRGPGMGIPDSLPDSTS